MLFLSYTVGKGVLTAMYFLFTVPLAMTVFSLLTIKKLKTSADEHFSVEDMRIEAFNKEKELEEDVY